LQLLNSSQNSRVTSGLVGPWSLNASSFSDINGGEWLKNNFCLGEVGLFSRRRSLGIFNQNVQRDRGFISVIRATRFCNRTGITPNHEWINFHSYQSSIGVINPREWNHVFLPTHEGWFHRSIFVNSRVVKGSWTSGGDNSAFTEKNSQRKSDKFTSRVSSVSFQQSRRSGLIREVVY
jgi:hypothetical protein